MKILTESHNFNSNTFLKESAFMLQRAWTSKSRENKGISERCYFAEIVYLNNSLLAFFSNNVQKGDHSTKAEYNTNHIINWWAEKISWRYTPNS